MIWAIVSSVYVIYLYRKLNASAGANDSAGAGLSGDVSAALARLEQRIGDLESRTKTAPGGIAP